MTEFRAKLEAVKNISDLYDLREYFQEQAERYSNLWHVKGISEGGKELRLCQEANFFLSSVNRQIEHYEKLGIFLNGELTKIK